jgi:sugar/nucleoside kinase (ribokinase family)
MTITEPSRQHDMIQALGERDEHRCSGGSAANTIIAFAQFGGSAAYASLLGADHFGNFYASEFKDLGIVLNAELVGGATTGSCLVLITPDSERTLNTTLAINTDFSRRHVDENLIKASEWVYIEGYKLTDDNGAEAVDHALFYAKKHDTRVAISCSDGFIIDVFGDRLRSVLQRADLVFCNEREGTGLAQTDSVHDAYNYLVATYPNAVLTAGAEGSRVRWNGLDAQIPAYKVQPVDTTGAGDMYAGAFLYGVLHRHHPEHAGRLASYASAQVVAQYGARLRASHIDVRDTVLANATTIA